ncbi:carboxylate--amine ligase [Streptomyces beihaiensis]|uniref:ATP-grasp domain-containing protein n=1 Tax=Streptomyces beihaiensis TaxID=2984495 RepID=A0ABT3U384_9ACTN|nr:ATP-grasp domain-containing protein [Streptomyces beihaiensis]MCX3062710.1 ATP-grasp domain-containing protein [Streptomyces beihaiensis]
MLDPCVPVVLLRLDPNPYHHGTLGAARSLGRRGVEVHLVADAGGGPVARSRYVTRLHAPPPPGAPDPDVLAALRRTAAQLDRPAVLIPMDDAGAVAVSRLRAPLSERYLLPRQPEHVAEQVADKSALPDLCRRTGIAHPATVLPADEREAYAGSARLGSPGVPVVAKWSRPWRLPQGSGLRSTSLLASPDEARELFLRGHGCGAGLLLQKYLAAGPGHDWFVHGYVDRHGVLRGGGVGGKRLAWPRGAGLTAVGRWTPVPELEAMAGRLVAALGYRGIFDLDFRVDAGTGRSCLLDFNPRPGAQFRLFADGTDGRGGRSGRGARSGGGLDVVRAQYADLTGQPVPDGRPLPGRTFVVENYAPLSALRLAPRSFAAREFAWWAPDDPAPARALAAEWPGHAARRLLRRAPDALDTPATPGIPAAPADPTDPTEPTNPADPADPADPTEPAAAAAGATGTAAADRKASC